MPQQLAGTGSALRVEDEHLLDEMDGLLRYLVIELYPQVPLVMFEFLLIELLPGAEGQVLVEHLIDDDAQRPDIYLLIVVMVPSYFWRHIVEGANFGPAKCDLINEAKIDEFDGLFLLIEEDVLRLEVPMYEPLIVEVLESLEDLLHYLLHLLLVLISVLEVRSKPRSSVIHQQPYLLFGLLVKEELDDIGMVELIQYPYLIDHAFILLLEPLTRNLTLMDHLERISRLAIPEEFDLAEGGVLANGRDVLDLLEIEDEGVGDLDG